ncbi:MAG TPA: 5-deoxy-glucuronate isomerase [Terriglobia bacterium]|nr:5-deoxy-glucuronate isomerase [Terriglobia bacterium]
MQPTTEAVSNAATSPQDGQITKVKPARLVQSSAAKVIFRQHFTPREGNLIYLSCGEFELPPDSESQTFSFAGSETLLFMWQGEAGVLLNGHAYHLRPYDTLYAPLGASFQLRNTSGAAARIVECSAPAEKIHSPFHSKFAEFSRQEARIRHLKGKDVYMMFDVSEPADKLVAGYTFFLPNQRSWPPHNHTDQEEVYFFIKGRGAMEVYESPETLSFVHPVSAGDMVTIPFLNYHPVFSQADPLEFIWCIAGERYWVGDKKKEFMSGTGPALTT